MMCLSQQTNKVIPCLQLCKNPKSKTFRVDGRKNQTKKKRSPILSEKEKYKFSQLILLYRIIENAN